MNTSGLSAPSNKEDIGAVLRGANPEIKKMLRAAHDQGFVVTRTNNNHYKVSTPAHYREQSSCFAPKTPSDVRGYHRVMAKLRNLGVKFRR